MPSREARRTAENGCKKEMALSHNPLCPIFHYLQFHFIPKLFFVKTFIYFCDLRHFLTCVFMHFASRAMNMTYDLLCISKACSMTFRKNQRFPAAPCETARGRAGLRYTRKQAAVYAGLRRAQAAKSSAITGGDRGGGICGLKCARKWGRSAQACVHTNAPRCMTAAGKALCGLTACGIRRYRRRR